MRVETGAASAHDDSDKNETSCVSSSLLPDEGERYSFVGATNAHLALGVLLLSTEWDVAGALEHFTAATQNSNDDNNSNNIVNNKNDSEDGAGQRKLSWFANQRQGTGRETNVEWGPLWLTQVRGINSTFCDISVDQAAR